MKHLSRLVLAVLLIALPVFAQDNISQSTGIIGNGRLLGAKTYDGQTTVGVLGIDSSGNTSLQSLSGKTVSIPGNFSLTGTGAFAGATFSDDVILANGIASPILSGLSAYSADMTANFAGNNFAGFASGANDINQVLMKGIAGAQGPVMSFAKSRATNGSADTIVTASDVLATVSFYGADGVNFRRAAQIVVTSDGTPGASDMPGAIDFQTTPDNDTTPASALKLSANKYALHGADAGFVSGATIAIQEATAGSKCMGSATANGTTAVTVSTTCATTGSRIFLTRSSAPSGTAICWQTNIVNGVSFDLDCSGAETGTFDWLIVHEAP